MVLRATRNEKIIELWFCLLGLVLKHTGWRHLGPCWMPSGAILETLWPRRGPGGPMGANRHSNIPIPCRQGCGFLDWFPPQGFQGPGRGHFKAWWMSRTVSEGIADSGTRSADSLGCCGGKKNFKAWWSTAGVDMELAILSAGQFSAGDAAGGWRCGHPAPPRQGSPFNLSLFFFRFYRLILDDLMAI